MSAGIAPEPLGDRSSGEPHDGNAGRAKIVLVGVIAIFVVLAAIIAVKTPAWESNDEPAHVQNIETLVAGHWYGMHLGKLHLVEIFGQKHNLGVTSGAEAHQPPLYYLLLAGWQRLAGPAPRIPNPGPKSIQTTHGSFAHHGDADLHFLLWLRIPNIVLGALTIWFTFLAARLITSDPWTPVVAASIVAFLPKFVFLSAFVTNDNLVNLLGALLTFVALRYAALSLAVANESRRSAGRTFDHYQALSLAAGSRHTSPRLQQPRMDQADRTRHHRLSRLPSGLWLVSHPKHGEVRGPRCLSRNTAVPGQDGRS